MICTHVCRSWMPEEGVGLPETRIVGCLLPDVGSGNLLGSSPTAISTLNQQAMYSVPINIYF